MKTKLFLLILLAPIAIGCALEADPPNRFDAVLACEIGCLSLVETRPVPAESAIEPAPLPEAEKNAGSPEPPKKTAVPVRRGRRILHYQNNK